MLRRKWGRAAACLLVLLASWHAGAESNFSFSIVGDRAGDPVPGVYERVWAEIDRLRPDFVINVGDTIHAGDLTNAAAEWEKLKQVWSRYGDLPQFVTPGNHDLWDEATRGLYEQVTGRPPQYGFDWQHAHFTVLDNSRTLDLSDDQLRFLEDDLERHRNRNPKFVFVHVPFWIVYLKLGSGEFDLHRLARKYGVGYIVSGHAHQWLRMERDGIVYLTVGSSGASISRGTSKGEGFEQGWFYHHVFARVSGAEVSLSVKEIDPPLGEGRRFSLMAVPESPPPAASDRKPE